MLYKATKINFCFTALKLLISESNPYFGKHTKTQKKYYLHTCDLFIVIQSEKGSAKVSLENIETKYTICY